MFWSGNYIAVRELSFLLKEENVTLTQVLEADDILQECKADNKNLIQFITRPDILAELITLITEEPPKNVELAFQYRHASIACEVLTSHLSMLSDRLSLDVVQMNRLCDFLKKEPPLNPLLASYFSQTVEMLLERSPKQDCYLYHIVCLRVLDFFKSRTDFLPNLLRHISTSAIADVFKYFLRLDVLFHKTVIEWLDEHQFLECLIQIICGSYIPEPLEPPGGPSAGVSGEVEAGAPAEEGPQEAPAEGEKHEQVEKEDNEHREKGDSEPSEKVELNHTGDKSGEEDETSANSDSNLQNHEETIVNNTEPSECPAAASEATANSVEPGKPSESNEPSEQHNPSEPSKPSETDEQISLNTSAERIRAVAAHNATELLCDLLLNGCVGEGCTNRVGRLGSEVVSRVCDAWFVRSLLQHVFTAPQVPAALQRGAALLRHMLALSYCGSWWGGARTAVERAVAPHLPLLHHALLHPSCEDRVGGARVLVAALVAQLALSDVQEVAMTIITLGTANVLLSLFEQYPCNSFLQAHVYTFIKHALDNPAYRTQYANHLLIECDLLNRLMDIFEENENPKPGVARAGHMGHVILILSVCARSTAPVQLPAPLRTRWDTFHNELLKPKLKQHDTPLGGYYPSDNTYEVENMADPLEAIYDINQPNYMMNQYNDEVSDEVEGDGDGDGGVDSAREQAFISVVMQRLQHSTWDDEPEGDGGEGAECGEDGDGEGEEGDADEEFNTQRTPAEILNDDTPWSSCTSAPAVEEGWASFGDAFSDGTADGGGQQQDGFHDDLAHYWNYARAPPDGGDESSTESVTAGLQSLQVSCETPEALDSVNLTNNLLTAMSSMTPDVIANIVNANLPAGELPLTNSAHSDTSNRETLTQEPEAHTHTDKQDTNIHTDSAIDKPAEPAEPSDR